MFNVSFRSTSNNPFPLVDATGTFGQQLQPQYTAIAPQFTSFNPYQQQAQQEAMQVRFVIPVSSLRV